MEALAEHTIPFAGLKEGAHAFDFVLGEAFFKATEMEEYEMGGDVNAHVDLDISEHLLIAQISVSGYLNVPCDHCNAPMRQPVKGDQRQIFKLTTETGIDDEELVALDVSAHEVNLTHYFFECIALHLPIRHVHPTGQCDPEVDQAFQNINVDPEPEPDPRWNVLQDLKNKKN
jgi:uncharacterized protein